MLNYIKHICDALYLAVKQPETLVETMKICESEDRSKKSKILRYSVNAQIGGKLAQLGSRLIDSTSKKLAGKFFDNFVKIVDGTTKIEEEMK